MKCSQVEPCNWKENGDCKLPKTMHGVPQSCYAQVNTEAQVSLFGSLPVICMACGHEDTVRCSKGVKLSDSVCAKCGHRGLRRNTDSDKEKPKRTCKRCRFTDIPSAFRYSNKHHGFVCENNFDCYTRRMEQQGKDK